MVGPIRDLPIAPKVIEVPPQVEALYRRLDIMKEVIQQEKNPKEIIRYLKLIKTAALCYCCPKGKVKIERSEAMKPLLTEINALIQKNGGKPSDRNNTLNKGDKWDTCSTLWLEMIQIDIMQSEIEPAYYLEAVLRVERF
jgi:hypothetical protein